MIRNFPCFALFFAGLAVVGWVGGGYLGSNALAAAVTLVIAACYVTGALELWRYRQATSTLTQAVADTSAAGPDLGHWLDRLHPDIRHAVRLRVEGERVALPAPVLTPYLVGLLVLLGMLGTLLGMMATLRGTGLALDGAADLAAIRGSLAMPIKGLGFAFGTSIAGVAASAMLGLLSALCRRERQQAVQRLDAEIATSLHVHSPSHQREKALQLLQQQVELMPALVDRLQAMMTTIERQGAALGERLASGQDDFHVRTEAAYAHLATSLEQSLRTGIEESARAVGTALQPAVEATLAGLGRETAAMHDTVGQAAQRQLEALSSGFGAATALATDSWSAAASEQRRSNEALAGGLRDTLDRFAATFEQRSAGLLEGVSARLDTGTTRMAEAWGQALVRQDDANARFAERNEQALTSATAVFAQHAASLVQEVTQSHAQLQQTLASQDEQRLTAWTGQLASTSAALRGDWERAGADGARRQREICDALARSAQDIAEQARAHAGGTIAEVSRLVQVASEAPRAAAEVIAELRQKLSESMVRDTAMLEERNQLMATLQTLLDAVNHASTEQRTAIDALVATSADLLERVGDRFGRHVEAETGKLDAVAAQVTAGAVEVASLGDAFGAAAQSFGRSNEELLVRLQGIEGALERSLARSDEQLAYYVAQAREVVDLSMLAQRQIMADLQQLGGARAPVGIEAA